VKVIFGSLMEKLDTDMLWGIDRNESHFFFVVCVCVCLCVCVCVCDGEFTCIHTDKRTGGVEVVAWRNGVGL
jgi:hypothetical protein